MTAERSATDMKKITTLMCVALLGAVAAHAVPAKRIWRTYTQPDGTTIELMQGGDEFCHYYTTRTGDYVLTADDGLFTYAAVDARGQLAPSGIAVGSHAAATLKQDRAAVQVAINNRALAVREARKAPGSKARKTIAQSGMGRYTSNYPRTGDVHCLVFLVEYTDVKFKTNKPQEYYDDFCNSDNFTADGATGSVGKYFRDQSDNRFRPVYDVFGPVPLKYSRSYYGGNDAGGNDKNPEAMVIEAVEYYKNQIDFSKYDYDNDGYVDNIFILYAGQGEASYGPASSVWPHSFELKYTRECPVYNGKKVNSYTCTNEWEDTRPDGIGTFCHEFSHTMGLPDLYHTTNSYAGYTPDIWSVLDYGPYNNDGRTPPNYSIYERNAMGWIEPMVLDGPACITLEEITTNTGCLIETEKQTEFFLLENRQQTGWDTYVPGHGMLIWHIDFNQGIFDNNSVNNTASHQYVDIVEANNNPSNSTESNMAGYPFPGTQNKTSFTSTTLPAMKSWAGRAIDMPLTNIREVNGVIMFDVAGGYFELDAPTGLKVDANDEGQLAISWNAVENAGAYLLTITTMVNDEKVPFGKYDRFNVGNVTSVTIDGATGRTEYFVTVEASRGQFSSDPSEEVAVTTPAIPMEKTQPVIHQWSSESANSFTLNWMPIQDAVDYKVTVHAISRGGETSSTYDFGTTDKPELPAGWTCKGNAEYYTTANNFGESAPSFKLGVKAMALTTSVFPSDISSLTFWVRGMSTNTKSYLTVNGRADEDSEWVPVLDELHLTEYNSKGSVITVDAIPAGVRQLTFVYTKGTGNMALDDICVAFAGEEKSIFADYDAKSVGNVTSHEVVLNGARAEAPLAYEAHIVAVDADGTNSLPSETVRVVPGSVSGITAPEAVTLQVSVEGNRVVYTGTEGTVSLYNAAGMAVGSASTSGSTATLTAPAPGLYILATPEGAVKLQITH